MRVAVLGGGRSSEHEVSLASAAAVREGLAEGGHEPVEVLVGRDGRFSSEGAPLALEPGGGLLGADVAFPVLHGPFGEDGTVQGLLELLDLPYVGAGVAASALAMDKVLFKEVMAQAGLPQVDYVALREGEDRSPAATLGFPVFVKPARLGSSVGIAKVSSGDELGPALDAAFAHDSLVIVEAFSAGLEVECSVLGNGSPEASEPGEIAIDADWYDYEAKYRPGGMELVIPAGCRPRTARRCASWRCARSCASAAQGWRERTSSSRPGRPGAAQRAEHAARLHPDQCLRAAVRGQRRPVLRAPVAPAGPGGGALRG